MKKMKLLPLLGVALLGLVGCSGSSNEISHKKAQRVYDPDWATGWTIDGTATRKTDLTFGGTPSEVISVKKGAGADYVDSITAKLCLTDIYGYLSIFEDGYSLDSLSYSFANTDDNIYQMAKYFQEKPTYTLDGKIMTVSFTGSTQEVVEATKLGLAMFFEAKYNKAGIITEAQYELVATTDLNKKNEADTKLRYLGEFKATWQEAI